MHTGALLGTILLACGAIASVHAATQGPPQTIASLDLTRYVGRWYEIARLPNSFQSQCVSDVTATYQVRSDGRLDVVNRCRTTLGAIDQAVGVARIADPATKAKLQIRFAPAYLSFLPFVWGDYWVLAIDPDYRWALVGTPDRDYLWILSRVPALDEPQYAAALAQAAAQGFDVGRIVQTTHPSPEAEPAGAP